MRPRRSIPILLPLLLAAGAAGPAARPAVAQAAPALDQAARPDDAAQAVTALLQEQAAAWNRGDLDAFCAVYAEDATFVTPSGMTRGRATILAHYRERYPDRAAMGTLSLDVQETRPVPAPAAVVPASATAPQAGAAPVAAVSLVARWRLAYPNAPEKSGLTLLVFHHRSGGGWEIVQDASM